MKKQKTRLDSEGHTMKSRKEKELYHTFLNKPGKEMDTTADDEQDKQTFFDTDKDIESVKNIKKIDKNKQANSKPKPYKSLGTLLDEYLKEVIFVTIILGTISVCVGVVWQQQKDIGGILVSVESIKTNLTELKSGSDGQQRDNILNTKTITEIVKDVEFIKTRLQKIEGKFRI